MNDAAANWTPDSWRDKPIVQQPKYADALALNTALDAVRSMPPLVNHV